MLHHRLKILCTTLILFAASGVWAEPKNPAMKRESEGTEQSGPQVTKAPVLKTFIPAEYPEAAKSKQKAGDVILALTIQEDGTVIIPEALRPLCGFDKIEPEGK